jgi:hypothetical protein
VIVALACVPEGPRTETEVVLPPTDPLPAPLDEPPPSASQEQAQTRGQDDPLISGELRDDFERSELGELWRPLASGWRIEAGQLCGMAAKNRGVWLTRTLPVNARIEFDARSDSADGDLKVELWGDGHSGAKSASYNHASSYLAIFGGWQNRRHVLARLDEHGDDRLSLEIGGDDARARPVERGRVYHFKFERSDGKTLSWWVDDVLVHQLVDDAPLAGPGHDHFGFNDWQAHVCFDNVRITAL